MCKEKSRKYKNIRMLVPIFLLSCMTELMAQATPAHFVDVQMGSYTQGWTGAGGASDPFDIDNSLVIEAEDMAIRTGGGLIGDSWCLFSNGTLAEVIEFREAGVYQVVVRAYGSSMDDQWPLMALSLDGVDRGTVEVDSNLHEEYAFQVWLEPGVHFIGVSFLNDSYNVERNHRSRLAGNQNGDFDPGAEDRNLCVDRFAVISPSGVEKPDLSGTLVVEAEEAKVRTTGEPVPDGWALTSNGTLGSDVRISAAGTYQVVVQAYGSPMDGIWPLMALNVDGFEGEAATVDSNFDMLYHFEVELDPANYFMGVSFLNDAHSSGIGDRNLYVDRFVIISPPGVEKPELAGTLVIEAEEAAIKTAGEPILNGWCLCENGVLGDNVQILEVGTYEVVVRAYGSPEGGIWPLMSLHVDGIDVETVTVDSGEFMDYSFQVELGFGVHFVGVSFQNDGYDPGIADRNLYLDRLVIFSPPGTLGPKLRLVVQRPNSDW